LTGPVEAIMARSPSPTTTDQPMKKLLIAALLAGVPSFAFAKNFAIPKNDPVATVVLPDDWDADAIDSGVEVTSKDGEVYIAFETVKAADVKTAVGEAIDYLVSKGVKLDSSSMKQKEVTVNGLSGVDIDWIGTDKDGDTEISLMVLGASKDRLVMLTYWGTPEGGKANGEELNKIAQSIKPVN
jgi:hypothetical protein